MVKEQEQENWITFDDGAFISKRNWKVRSVTRITIILAIFAVPFLTISYLTVKSSSAFSDFVAIFGFIALFYFSFRIAVTIGSIIFRNKFHNFLIHYKDDWRPNGVTRDET